MGGQLLIDTINENTTNNGVVIESVTLKDNILNAHTIEASNFNVYGTQTIINSEVLNVDDNIIIVNADGEFIQQAGLQANIDGNLYGLLYDTDINAWTINNKNLHLNKLVGNEVDITVVK